VFKAESVSDLLKCGTAGTRRPFFPRGLVVKHATILCANNEKNHEVSPFFGKIGTIDFLKGR